MAAALLVWAWLPLRAALAWPGNPTVNVPICTQTDTQLHAAVGADGSGGAIITWRDWRNGGYGNSTLYAQHIDSTGSTTWAADGVPYCTSTPWKGNPLILGDGAGGAFIVWDDERAGSSPSESDIYAQRLNASGIAQWTANGVAVTAATSMQFLGDLVSDGAGGIIVAWQDRRTPDNDIYVQRLNGSGVPQWTANGVALTATVGAGDWSPRLAADGSGGAIVAWQKFDTVSGTDDIYAQRVNASGAPQWTANGVPICTAASDQTDIMMVSDGAGGAIITWDDGRPATYSDIYAQRVNSAGVVQWAANGVAVVDEWNYDTQPRIVANGLNGAFIAWNDYRQGPAGDTDVYVQWLNAAGTEQWTHNGVQVGAVVGDQAVNDLVSDSAGGVIVLFEDDRTGDLNIYMQHLNSSGAATWATNGLAVSTASDEQTSWDQSSHDGMVSDGAGGAITAWKDYRSGTNYDIYSQRVYANGSLDGVAPSTTSSTTTTSTTSTTLPGTCPSSALVGCRQAEPYKSKLTIIDKVVNSKDKVVWVWNKGEATSVGEFLNPVANAATIYTVCLYDNSLGTQPLGKASVPSMGTCSSSPCWKALGSSGFRYNDKAAATDSVASIMLKEGIAGKARAKVKIKGGDFGNPSTPAPPLTGLVRMQLSNGTTCWEGYYSGFNINVTGKFRAKGPPPS